MSLITPDKIRTQACEDLECRVAGGFVELVPRIGRLA
jgi:hypothetical protein